VSWSVALCSCIECTVVNACMVEVVVVVGVFIAPQPRIQPLEQAAVDERAGQSGAPPLHQNHTLPTVL
jgi:hypothetical protein